MWRGSKDRNLPSSLRVIVQAGQKEAEEMEAAVEAPAKEAVGEEAKDTKPVGGVPVENGSAKLEKQEEAKPEKEKEKKKKKYLVDEELLLAFRYFDRNCESLTRSTVFCSSARHACSDIVMCILGMASFCSLCLWWSQHVASCRLRLHQSGRSAARCEQPRPCAEPAHCQGAVPQRGRCPSLGGGPRAPGH